MGHSETETSVAPAETTAEQGAAATSLKATSKRHPSNVEVAPLSPPPHDATRLVLGYNADLLNQLINPVSVAAVLWYVVWSAFAGAERIHLLEDYPPGYASAEWAAYAVMAVVPFHITAGWFQANILAARGNDGFLLGVMGPVFQFTATVVTQSQFIAMFFGSIVAYNTFYSYVLLRHSQSRVPISFVLMALINSAQFGLACATYFLPALKAALHPAMAGLIAPAL